MNSTSIRPMVLAKTMNTTLARKLDSRPRRDDAPVEVDADSVIGAGTMNDYAMCEVLAELVQRLRHSASKRQTNKRINYTANDPFRNP